MKGFMGLITEEDSDLPKDKYIKDIINILQFNGIYQGVVKKVFEEIMKLGDSQIIDFELLDKGLKRNLLKIRYILNNIPYDNKNTEVLDKEYPEVLTVLKPLPKYNDQNQEI